jgi:hypothetical protein
MAIAAQVVDFASRLTKGREAALTNFGRRLQGGSLTKARTAAAGTATRLTRQAALKIADKLPSVNIDTVVDAETNTMQHLKKIAPRAANLATATAVTAVEFLRSKIPTKYQAPWGGRSLVDPVSADRFARYAEAVTDPNSVWDRLASGTLTTEHVEALRAVYPATYKEVQSRVWDELGKLESPPPFEARITLGVLLDLPTDPSLDQRGKHAVQAMVPQEQLPPPSGGRSTVLAGGAGEVEDTADKMTPPGAAGEVRRRS